MSFAMEYRRARFALLVEVALLRHTGGSRREIKFAQQEMWRLRAVRSMRRLVA